MFWIENLLCSEQSITYHEEANEKCAKSSEFGAEFIVTVVGELNCSSIDVKVQTFVRHIVDR